MFKRSTLTIQQADNIAQQICSENGWPCLSPIRLETGFFTYTIRTNATHLGTNTVIKFDRLRGKVIQVNYQPR